MKEFPPSEIFYFLLNIFSTCFHHKFIVLLRKKHKKKEGRVGSEVR